MALHGKIEGLEWTTVNSASDVPSDAGVIVSKEEVSAGNAIIIKDETDICAGGSNNGWWMQADSSADFICFGKRMQASGFYSKHGHFT